VYGFSEKPRTGVAASEGMVWLTLVDPVPGGTDGHVGFRLSRDEVDVLRQQLEEICELVGSDG
jgi:hypothetical protein